MIAFRVLGSVSLTGEGGSLSGKPVQPRRMALLALLAGYPRHTLSREKLMAFLWPESPGEQARHRLSESLYVLRRALGDEALISEGDQVRLDPERLGCDLVAFRSALEEKDLDGAVALYTGPFLDGFFLRDSEEFNRWVESERESLATAFGRAMEELAVAAENEANLLKAVAWWKRLSLHDPYNSRFALRLMEGLTRAGDPGNAIQHAEDHAKLLRKELEADPPAELLAYAESLRNGHGSRSGENGPVVTSGGGPPGVSIPWMTESPVPSEPTPWGTRDRGPTPPRAPPGSRPLGWVVAPVLLVGVLGVGSLYSSLHRNPVPTTVPNLVIVPPFENRTDEPEMGETGRLAAQWLEEAIQQVDGVQLVPSTFAQGYVGGQDGDRGPDPMWAVAERTRASWVVGGVIRKLGDSLELRAEVINVGHQRKEQEVVEAGLEEDLNQILDRLARRVAGALAYEFDPGMREVEGAYQPLPFPPTIEAFREHRLGYQAYNERDYASSFRHHMTAFTLDTTLVRSLVAAAYMTGDYELRDSLAQLADARRHLLSIQGKLDLDILLALLSGDHQGAYRAIQETAQREGAGFSSVLEASFAMRLNLPRAGLRATERYDPNLEWRQSEAHAYWRSRAQAFHMLGEHHRELAEAQAGRERYPNLWVLLGAEIRALAALGKTEQLRERLLQARSLPGSADSIAVMAGAELRAHGHLEASRSVFRQATEWLRDDLVRNGDAFQTRFQLARALYGAEAWAEAQEEAEVLLGQDPESLRVLGLLGCAGARRGDTILAEEMMNRLSGMDLPYRPGENLYQMATIAAVLGRNDEAAKLLYESFAHGLPHGLRLHQDMNFEPLRERPEFIALVTPKG